ncbi:MBL fold metallo-hydrolase [Haloferax namakaokahaiae]|uniref:MBL fold metallo-hydrolase n=1 Tax=Haloferax namakaokahaiae TaxID=1748331 RepID=A0ABD5ZGJ5_9EURY
MKITYLGSAALLVETKDTDILCDPWLVDGAYFGSWCHYPPREFEPEDFNDVDYIYISHVHPDHYDPATLDRMDTDIPVLIHDYRWDYLRDRIENQGFDVIELPHGERTHLQGETHINILAADGCDPELCGNFFGCTWYDDQADTFGSTQVDSLAVIDDGSFTMVNTNDCPYPIAEQPCRQVKEQYGHVDLLAHQYSAAQFYPQAMGQYSHEQKLEERDRVIREKHELALNFIDLFEPDYYLPFAGEYVLAGKLAHLTQYTANPPREEAREFFLEHVDRSKHEPVFLNANEHIDLTTGERSKEFEPDDKEAKREYVETVLAKRTFTYERDPHPTLDELKALIPSAYDSLENKRTTIGFETDTHVLVPLVEDEWVDIRMNGGGYEYTTSPDLDYLADTDGYVVLDTDDRLVRRLLDHDDHAHWADAKIGSHIQVYKQPDIYERGLYNCMGSFHA